MANCKCCGAHVAAGVVLHSECYTALSKTMTGCDRAELMRLRARVKEQRETIKRLEAKIKEGEPDRVQATETSAPR